VILLVKFLASDFFGVTGGVTDSEPSVLEDEAGDSVVEPFGLSRSSKAGIGSFFGSTLDFSGSFSGFGELEERR